MEQTEKAMSEFMQDNLLTDDDWGTLNLVDLSDLTATDPKNLVDHDFLIKETGHELPDYSTYSDDSEDKHTDPDMYSSISPSSDHQEIVDEFLEDIIHSSRHISPPKNDPAFFSNTDTEGFRRFSTHTSSSSAYSSCSSDASTPPPQSVEIISDQVSCSSGEHSLDSLLQEQDTLTSPDSTSEFEVCFEHGLDQDIPVTIIRENESKRSNSHARNNRNHLHSSQKTRKESLTSETELEKAVRIACEETNRLLKMHNKSVPYCKPLESSGPPKNAGLRQPNHEEDILRNVCESTILDSHVTKSNADVSKPLKRKATTTFSIMEKLQSSVKKPSLSGKNRSQTAAPFSRTALLNSNTKVKTIQQETPQNNLTDTDKQCFIISQQPPKVLQTSTIADVTISPTQSFTITPTIPTTTPLQVYVKQESTPTLQPPSYPVINGIIQSPQSTFVNNQKVFVSNSPGLGIGLQNQTISIVKPEPLICQGGQTIVIHQPPVVKAQPQLQQVSISDIKPGSDPVVLSQSDLSSLAAQGLIKFPQKKTERCLKPSSNPNKHTEVKTSSQSAPAPKKPTIVPAQCDVLPNKAAAIINGTTVLMNGADNQPQRGEIDIKALKRHQRMIKNRASACQSRQRRKEYLKTLEDQVTEVAEENKLLREENETLKIRVNELEKENENLRKIIGLHRTGQKRAVCILMLVLFIGINVFPFGGLVPDSGSPPFQSDAYSGSKVNQGLEAAILSQGPVRTGRHLLSTDDNIIVMDKSDQNKTAEVSGKELIVPEKKSFWMDDLVKEYKSKHFESYFQILSETSSASAKRLLRRKIKEELGINVPLPVPRQRRIAYTPRTSRKLDSISPPKESVESTSHKSKPRNEHQHFPQSSKNMPTSLPQPCDHNSYEESEMNETETIRMINELSEWAQRYSFERQVKAQQDAQKKDVKTKKHTSTKAPSSRYEVADNTIPNNEIVVYSKPAQKYDDFLDAINRKNDTFYVISLNKEHLLIPATVQNSTSRTKMALVMPAIATKGASSHGRMSDEYETMIHIECEVLNTRIFELKRNDVPEFFVITKDTKMQTIDPISNETLSNTEEESLNDRKTRVSGKTKRNKSDGKKRSMKRYQDSRHKHKKAITDHSNDQEEDAVVSDVVDSDTIN